MNVAQETLGFRRAGLSPALSLLMSAFALPIPPAALSSHLRRLTERSSTTPSTPSTSLPAHSPRCFAAHRRAAFDEIAKTQGLSPDPGASLARSQKKGDKPFIEARGPFTGKSRPVETRHR